MRMRVRKFIGAVTMISFVLVYALCAMALAQARPLQDAAPPVQIFVYAVLGLVWILPLMPLIRWMQRPGP
jgi:predicted membrane channel-forming protein YqfA (hemolysin III family)